MAKDSEIPVSLMGMMIADAGEGVPEISDRDMAEYVLDRLDYEQQMIAITGLLQRNEEADKRIETQMKDLDDEARSSSGWRNEHAIDEWGEYFHLSIYQDAAHSMAAVGMIAPLFESLFFNAFQAIRGKYFGVDTILPGCSRAAITEPDKFWDCHNYFDRRDKEIKLNLVVGIQQLSTAVGLKPYLPVDLRSMLEALIEYRNCMFHNGFEWPEERCGQFAERVANSGWQDWFSNSERGHKPWMFYMTRAFIAHCIEMLHRSLDALGAYCKNRVPIRYVDTSDIPAPTL